MAETYIKTHPWLTFRLPLNQLSHIDWMLLGEARSKCEHLAGVPLRPSTAQQLHRLYLAKGVLATTAIEGNTLTQEQVELHLEGKLQLPPSKQYLEQEIRNILTACNMIGDTVFNGVKLPLKTDIIVSFNRMILDGLELQEGVKPGELRAHDVGVARYKAPKWQECEPLMNRLADWLAELETSMPPELGIGGAILRAIVAHLYIAWIHPFGDGNGRTARLVEFAILVAAGVPFPAAHLLSNHYNETRTKYYLELDRASKSGGDIVPFINYALQGFVDGLKAQLGVVREQQLDVVWRNYVHEQISGQSPSDIRRKHLVLDLSRISDWTKVKDLMTLTPRIAQEYSGKTRKTLSRDLNVLHQRGLVLVFHGRARAHTEVIRAFLPKAAAAGPRD